MRERTRAKELEKTGAAPTAALELVRSFRGPLVAYFLKRVNSRSEAEDMTQEAHPGARFLQP